MGLMSNYWRLANFWIGVAALCLVSLCVGAEEAEPQAGQAAAPLFASHAPLQVTIEAPLTTLMRERPNEEYLPGTFSFTEDDGTKRTLDLKLRTRGKYRREERHCDFAPIKLNFRKSQVIGTILDGQDKLKLVTHCRSKKQSYEQLLLREYFAYRVIGAITTSSYGVRLFHIRYVDTEGAEPITKPAFVIEDIDAVAARHGMQPVRTGHISSNDLDRRQQNLVHIFQYLIGNTEYSLFKAEPNDHCCHNSDLMSSTGDAPFTPLAYDFDFAGIVNAPYAEPNPRYKLRSVRQRLYKGLCKNNDLLPLTLQSFAQKRDEIYAIIDAVESLNRRSERALTRYLNEFYDRIEKPKSVERRFIWRCNEVR